MKKSIIRIAGIIGLLTFLSAGHARAQAVKTNIPLILAGSPNVGIEWNVGRQFTVNGDVLWMPYMA